MVESFIGSGILDPLDCPWQVVQAESADTRVRTNHVDALMKHSSRFPSLPTRALSQACLMSPQSEKKIFAAIARLIGPGNGSGATGSQDLVAPEGQATLCCALEIELKGQLNPAMTVLICHLSETGRGIWVNYETLRRIAYVIGAHRALAIRRGCRQVKARLPICRIGGIKRVYRQVTKVTLVRIWKCLVEDIEEPDAELQLLGLSNVEVLEGGDIKIPGCRSAHVKRRLRRAVGSKRRHFN